MMATYRVSAYVVLLSLCLGLTNRAGLARLFFSHPSKFQEEVCATHGTSCVCPKICAELKKQPSKEACHPSSVPEHRPDAGQASTASLCLLKAGCGERELLPSFGFLLEDFLPEEFVTSNGALPVSFLTSCFFSTVLPDPFFQFFHPPKTS